MTGYTEEGELRIPGKDLLKLLGEVQDRGGVLRFHAEGYSMTPAICSGDRIILSPSPGEKVQVGDIVLFSKPDKSRAVLHRVIRISGDKLLTRGDNTDENDGWINRADALGVVSGVERKGRPVKMIRPIANPLCNGLRFRVYQIYLWARRMLVSVKGRARRA